LILGEIFFAENACSRDSDRLVRLVRSGRDAFNLSDETLVRADFTEYDVFSVEVGSGDTAGSAGTLASDERATDVMTHVVMKN